MRNIDYQLKRGTALLIVGSRERGSITLARQIARPHGEYLHMKVTPGFSRNLGDKLISSVKTLIVEGELQPDHLAELKQLITEPSRHVRQPYSTMAEAAPNPLVIVCVERAGQASWFHERTRRFHVIDLREAGDHV